MPLTDSGPLSFVLPDDLGSLVIEAAALLHFRKNVQRNYLAKEAGGQLFAQVSDPKRIMIVHATGPRVTDRRSVFSYKPDRNAERLEIADFYKRGLHFVGDWHTHPQRYPSPSGTDNQSMREMVRLSTHDFAGFVMIVVGRAQFPEGLHVSLHGRKRSSRLVPLDTNPSQQVGKGDQ